jgi:hypothetical protein
VNPRADPLHFDEVVSADNGGEFRLRLLASFRLGSLGPLLGPAALLLSPLVFLSQQSNYKTPPENTMLQPDLNPVRVSKVCKSLASTSPTHK